MKTGHYTITVTGSSPPMVAGYVIKQELHDGYQSLEMFVYHDPENHELGGEISKWKRFGRPGRWHAWQEVPTE